MTVDLGIEGFSAVEEIGRGGSARVFRAWQDELDRPVAIKVLHSVWDDSAQRRFDRERKAMGRLSTVSGIADIYASGMTSTGVPYIVMPYYQRGSLEELIATDGPQPWGKATSIIASVASTIADAHRVGILHRDLKPANVLIGDDGFPKIADFGISTLVDQTTSTVTSGLTFTPSYSPPEAFASAVSTPQRDVYGLGATLWALIAGRAPFSTTDERPDLQQTIHRVLNEPVGDLRPLGVPDQICTLIDRAMAKNPADRFPDAASFLNELGVAIRTIDARQDPSDAAAPESPPQEPGHTIQVDHELAKPMSVDHQPDASLVGEHRAVDPSVDKASAENPSVDESAVDEPRIDVIAAAGLHPSSTSDGQTRSVPFIPVKTEKATKARGSTPRPRALAGSSDLGLVLRIAVVAAGLIALATVGAVALTRGDTPAADTVVTTTTAGPTTEPSGADAPGTESSPTTVPPSSVVSTDASTTTVRQAAPTATVADTPRSSPNQPTDSDEEEDPEGSGDPTTEDPIVEDPPPDPDPPPPCPTWNPDCGLPPDPPPCPTWNPDCGDGGTIPTTTASTTTAPTTTAPPATAAPTTATPTTAATETAPDDSGTTP